MSHFNNDTPPDKKKICPPLTVYSIISFAWGMTLLISQQQDTQGKIALESLSIFRVIRAKYHNENPHDKFLDDISFHMNGYFRTIAINREIYFINLKTWETKRQKIVDYWNDLSNMTSISFSIQGIIVKIATFF